MLCSMLGSKHSILDVWICSVLPDERPKLEHGQKVSHQKLFLRGGQ